MGACSQPLTHSLTKPDGTELPITGYMYFDAVSTWVRRGLTGA
jgi:hypothetical protein